jgi:hypothetical protein
VATLNRHSAPDIDDTARDDTARDDTARDDITPQDLAPQDLAPTDDGPAAAHEDGNRPARTGERRRLSAPRSRMGYSVGVATVCVLALFNLVAGEPAASATADPQEQASVAVADALGIDGAGIEEPSAEEPELLGQLAASRAERDAEQAAAADSQAQAEQAAAAAKAEAEAKAAAEAAAAAAAAAEAEAQAKKAAEEKQAAAAPAAAAPAAGTTATAVAKITNSAGPIRPQAQAAANAVVSNVPGAGNITLGGTRASAADPHGHPSGLAVDYMVGSDSALGDAIVEYHIAHWDELGVEYIIWQQRMLSSPNGSWKQMENRGSATANHMDHPHVNYRG